MTLNTTTRKMAMQSQTHVPQQITINTRKLLDKVIKKTKLSRPKQLELLVEEYYKNLIPNRKKTQDHHFLWALRFFLVPVNLRQSFGTTLLWSTTCYKSDPKIEQKQYHTLYIHALSLRDYQVTCYPLPLANYICLLNFFNKMVRREEKYMFYHTCLTVHLFTIYFIIFKACWI